MAVSIGVRFPPNTAKPVPVRVNGVIIPRDSIVREMQYHPADRPAAAWQEAARSLVVRELLLERAKALGLTPEPVTDADGRRETDEEALIRAVVEREVTVPEPDAETCRRYYENNKARFRSPDIYEASHILFAALPSDQEAYAQARADADAVLAALQHNPESFAAMAQAYSRCPSATQGGNLGQITMGQTTTEFEQALFALNPGCMTETLVPTRYGFHIIRLHRKVEGQQLPFEFVTSRIADYLRESVVRRAAAQYIARLAATAQIEGIDLTAAETMRVN
jgi:peptidyl-prolyl cis-trans isomerase C